MLAFHVSDGVWTQVPGPHICKYAFDWLSYLPALKSHILFAKIVVIHNTKSGTLFIWFATETQGWEFNNTEGRMNISAVHRGWLRKSTCSAYSGTSPDFNGQKLNVPHPWKYFRFKYTRRIAHLTWDHWHQQHPSEQLSAHWLIVLKLLPDPLRAKSQIPWKEHTRVGQKHWTGILMGTILDLGNRS